MLNRETLGRARDEAARAAIDAGVLIRAEAGRISAASIRNKGVHDLVTHVDDSAQALILERLKGVIDNCAVLAEEDRPAGSGTEPGNGFEPGPTAEGLPACRWIVDPIDGTTNFAHGVPPYAVSIALEYKSEIVVGVVYEVSRDELFTAVRGDGLQVNGRPASVSRSPTLDQSLLTTGFPYRSFDHMEPYIEVLQDFMVGARGVRRPGAASVDCAYVACGRFDGFYESGLAPWDVAAGTLLVREGGGLVTDFAGSDDPVYGRQIVASNGAIHAAMLAVLEPMRLVTD